MRWKLTPEQAYDWDTIRFSHDFVNQYIVATRAWNRPHQHKALIEVDVEDLTTGTVFRIRYAD
ncbi:MAG: hypothetical protein P8J32_01605 [bacterium]|nr:hypothetical protein [bacterium]